VPAIYLYRDFPAAGGLMSYASDVLDSYRLAGVYTGRVLKDENPAELPVVQAAKFELVINLTTAKALGINVPPSMQARADEMIE
jgi:putative ABC transport system substrate-binding protein